jgi:hypothetical protein
MKLCLGRYHIQLQMYMLIKRAIHTILDIYVFTANVHYYISIYWNFKHRYIVKFTIYLTHIRCTETEV